MLRHRLCFWVLTVSVAWASATTQFSAIAEPAIKANVPTAALPSPPGPQIAKVEALGNDSWLSLGPPTPDPKWGSARGRAWTPRMVYAPDLRAAFLCGCGQHGFVKPDGHFMDDLWVYDINGHRWICVYPGAPVATLQLELDEDGFEVNSSGEHVPVSYMGHGYANQTYVPHLRRLMLIFTHSPWWTRAMPQRWMWLDSQFEDVRTRNYGHAGPIIENSKHPLFYDVAEGRWERTFVDGEGPGPGRFEGVLEFIPSRRQAFYLFRGHVWFYDFATEKWLQSGAEQVDIAYDSNGCFDSRRERVYVARQEHFWAYDVRAAAWKAIHAKGQPEDLGNCNSGTLTYDSAGDVVVWHREGGAGIRIYDPDQNAWTEAAPPPRKPKVQWQYKQMHGFYDPVLNTHVYFLAGDSRDNGSILVYRYAVNAIRRKHPR